MKSIIAAVLVLFSSFSFAASYDMKTGDDLAGDKCAPGDLLYYGVTEKGTKDVIICQQGDTVTYAFGNIMKNWSGKDLVLDVKASTVINSITENDLVSKNILIIRNASNAYAITHSFDLHSGVEVNLLEVYNRDGSKKLATIKLDNEFVADHIRDNFVK